MRYVGYRKLIPHNRNELWRERGQIKNVPRILFAILVGPTNPFPYVDSVHCAEKKNPKLSTKVF